MKKFDFKKVISNQQQQTSNFKSITDGTYASILVGLTAHEVADFEDSSIIHNKIKLVFQVFGEDAEGESVTKYIATKPMTLTVSEKSNLFKLLSVPFKITSPDDLVKIINSDITTILGLKFQVSISCGQSGFENITGLLAPKKNQPDFDVNIKVPEYITNKAFDSTFIPEISL